MNKIVLIACFFENVYKLFTIVFMYFLGRMAYNLRHEKAGLRGAVLPGNKLIFKGVLLSGSGRI